jgi:hypothetical protein
MRTFWKVAAAMLALGTVAAIPARAQPYDDRYYGNDSASGLPGAGYYDDNGYYQGAYGDGAYGDDYADGYYGQDAYGDPYAYAQADYGADAYGYCDEYGCPDDYWSLPVYYGSVYYGDTWLNGPLYYRDWGGRHQYWIRGAWRYDGWRGARPSGYREGRYGPALGLNWYRTHHAYRQGWNGNSGYRTYRAPRYGAQNRFSTRADNRFRAGVSNNRYSGRSYDRDSNSFSGRRNWGSGSAGNSPRAFNGGGRDWSNRGGYRSQFSGSGSRAGVQAQSSGGRSWNSGRSWGGRSGATRSGDGFQGRSGGSGSQGGGGRHH